MVLKIPATLEMTTILERTELFLIRAQPHSTCRFRTALSGYREHSTDEELPSCSIIVMLHSCTGPCQAAKHIKDQIGGRSIQNETFSPPPQTYCALLLPAITN